MSSSGTLFSNEGFMPHGQCFVWQKDLLALQVVSDLLIVISYFCIPLALVSLIRQRQDLSFDWMFALFGLFIFFCGLTHMLSIITIWKPLYWEIASLKLFTGIISLLTAILLWKLIPKAVRLPSPQQLIEVNEKLVQSNSAFEKANQAKSDFLSQMSHELRTPLNAIIGFAQVLLNRKDRSLDDDQKEDILLIHQSGKHLLSLINELLDLSAIESGKVEIFKEKVRLHDVTKEVLALSLPLAEKEKIKIIDKTRDHSECHVLADPIRLKQVLLNLVSNAIKYNRKGGSVTLTCEKKNEDTVIIKVEDTGYGIPENHQTLLFQPFSRIKKSETEKVEGTGIGLSISKNIVELMGGRIHFTSIENQGSCFSIELSSSPYEETLPNPSM